LCIFMYFLAVATVPGLVLSSIIVGSSCRLVVACLAYRLMVPSPSADNAAVIISI